MSADYAELVAIQERAIFWMKLATVASGSMAALSAINLVVMIARHYGAMP